MRSGREDTKFHQMCRGPSIGSPLNSMARAGPSAARSVIRSPGRNTSNWPGPKRSPAISTVPETV